MPFRRGLLIGFLIVLIIKIMIDASSVVTCEYVRRKSKNRDLLIKHIKINQASHVPIYGKPVE